MQRIFEAFSVGQSPLAIARHLNDEGVRGPRGILWRDTAIRGHRQRGTGLLNNELYIGRLIWNRLRYVKDPQTGRRVSRLNPREAWIEEDVPDLRIIDPELWDRVKARQAEMDADPKTVAIKASRFWEHRRPAYLLTGLIRCGTCGGDMTAVGRDYLACTIARKLHRCEQRKAIRRNVLEEFVLDLVRDRIMQPAAVQSFVAAYTAEINASRAGLDAEHGRCGGDLAVVVRKLDGMYDAVADGLRTPGLLAKIEGLEADKARLEDAVARPAPSPVRLHPNLAEVYRKKVAGLREALADPSIRDEALSILRGLVEQVIARHGSEGWEIEVQGELVALVSLGLAKSKTPQPGLGAEALSSIKVVAGARFGLDRTSSNLGMVPSAYGRGSDKHMPKLPICLRQPEPN